MSVDGCHFCNCLRRLADLPPSDLIWQFDQSIVLLGPWQYYRGYCILVARQHVTEIHAMKASDSTALFQELCLLSWALETACRPRKINCESLGNQVPHLHWHLFPRYEHDPEKLKPVWVPLDRAEHDPAERQRLLNPAVDRLVIASELRGTLFALTESP